MPKVSVLIPVYNVESTLERCVRSVLDQSFQDFEIILVNDGSTDSSGDLCDKLAAKDNRITVIHKDNEGLGPTRNCGVRAAHGEYIYHCDSDDWISKDLLKNTVKAMDEYNGEILIFGYTIFTETVQGELSEYDIVQVPDGIIEGTDSVHRFFISQYYNSFSVQSACNRLYRREFLLRENLEFPALRRCQDMAFSLLLFSKATKVICLKEALYNYIIVPGIFKGRGFNEMIATYLDIFTRTSTAFTEWGLYDNLEEAKLKNKICEHIANYSVYAIEKKYPLQWRENLKELMGNQLVRALFQSYQGHSRFMKAFTWAFNHHSPLGIKLLSKLILLKK